MKYRFKTRPLKHQRAALKKFLKRGCGALFAEMGTGKTKIAIDWACALATMENRPLKAVVLCPKSVLTVWPDEIKKHDPYHAFGSKSGVEWMIVGIDSAWRPYHYDEIALWEPDILIVDESDTIKSPNSRRSKGAYLLSRHVKYKLIMSGTPIGNDILDLFAQFKVVDDSIFGTSFGAFKNEYALIRAHKVVKYLRQSKFKRKIKPYTFSILKSQCLDLPQRFGHAWDSADGPNIIHVPLSPTTRHIYDELAEEAVVEFEDMEVLTPIVLTRMLRLSQLASGWLIDGEQKKQIGKEKKMQLQYQLEEMRAAKVKKVVIFTRFRHEMRDAGEAAKAAGYNVLLLHGGVSDKGRAHRIQQFHKTKTPTVFIGQWQAGSRGIDLTCSSHCICYGLTYSLIQYGQGIDRQHRIGQTNHVNYYHYVADNTIDETVMESLIMKKKISQEIIEDPSLLYGSPHGTM